MVYGKQKFHVSHVRISQKLKCVIMWKLLLLRFYHFHVKTKVS